MRLCYHPAREFCFRQVQLMAVLVVRCPDCLASATGMFCRPELPPLVIEGAG